MPSSKKRRRRPQGQVRVNKENADDVLNEERFDDEREDNQEEEEEQNGEEEDDDEEDERSGKRRRTSHEQPKAQTPLRDRHVNPSGKPAEAGIIAEVYVENFMCHRKLNVKLCRNVNFIHGQNGSGKSAILAAIQVCLGAGARRTHRARNLKDLVRKEAGVDCSGARLKVKLLNRGEDGFQTDIYGDHITVERCISLRSGGYNGYKLLDATGKERSRSKKDLDAMLDQLNIQVENPVAVLDQEEAKKFLTGKAEDKYDFFTKATELERLDRCYAAIWDNVLELDDTKKRAISAMQGSIENTKRLENEWEQFQELDKLEAECQELRAMYGWALHMELSDQLDQETRNAQKYLKSLDKRRNELEIAEKAANVTDDEEIQYKNRLEELSTEASEAAKAKSQLEQDLKRSLAPIKQKEREREVLQRESANAKRRLTSAKRRLDDARKQILEAQGNAAEEERARTIKIAKTEEELAAAKEQVDPLKLEISKHLRSYQETEPSLGQAKEAKEAVERQFHEAQRKVKDLQAEAGGGDRALAVFGPKCKALYEVVQKAVRANKFKGPVAGPVGMYAKVVSGKEKYAKIAEFAIGNGYLDRFIVTNVADLELMKKFRREVRCNVRDCPLYQIHPRAAREKYRTPAPPEGVETVTSVLSVDNVLAFNFLVDAARIDESALADSKERSEEALLVIDANGRESIRGRVKKVYFLPSGDFWEAKGGSRMMVSNDRGLKQSIGVDRSAAIEAAKHEVTALQKEVDRTRKEEDVFKKEAFKYKKAWNDLQKENRKLNKNIENLQSTLEDLKADAETSEGVPSIDTSEMEEDVNEAEELIEEIKKKESAIAREIEQLQPTVEEQKRHLDEMTSRNEKVFEDLQKVEAKLEDIVKGHARRMEQVEKMRHKVKQHEDAVQRQQEILLQQQEKVSDKLLSARKLAYRALIGRQDQEDSALHGNSSKIDDALITEPTTEELESIEIIYPEKDVKYYKAKINSKTRKIDEERSRRNMSEVDPAVIREKYLRAKRDLDSKMEQIQIIKNNTHDLKHDIKDRRRRWRQFRSHIAEMTNLSFDEFLNKKGSCGEVEFDHDNGRLNLIVQKDNTDARSQTKDVKALSGGERSYATLSLLLAIGESLETPFRVMDEFDVFLDPMARKIALQTLIAVAKSMEHRQFIFITPQDLSNLKTDSKLKIFHMKPPERSNRMVGGPQQATLDFSPTDS